MDAAIVSQFQAVGFSQENAEALAALIASVGASKTESIASRTDIECSVDAWKLSLRRWIVGVGLAQIALTMVCSKLLLS